ncbi:MAG: DUF4136 domain-containing protein [Saprospiraceae bacterium]|nr:DUF4136 domain-containing protein [Pyrinomonadaceae bacterium]
MKLRTIVIFVALFAAASAAHAQKLIVDVDKSFDFKAVKTFGWSNGKIAPKESTGQLIIAAIERELTSRGLVRNDAEHDIQIAVMAAAGMDLQGVGPTWNNEVYRSWGGYGNPAALMTITSGDILIDVIETKNKHSIWRGAGKGIFVAPPSGNVEKDLKDMEKTVNKWIGKFFKKYPVKAS